ncbi:MAG: glycosyltransferase family 87 protein, partial [Planctomycetales bacterium]
MDGPAPSRTTRFRVRPGLVAALLIAAAGVAVVMPLAKEKSGDAAVYARGAARMIAGERVYRPEEGSAFTYPPFCGLYFVPLSALSEPVRRGCWYFANVALLGTIVIVVARQAWPVISAGARSGGPPVWGYFAIVGALSARFLISPIENQAHDLILLALVAATISAWGSGRDKAAGIWAGLATATKATPLLFLPVFLWQRRFAAAGALLATAAVATMLPDVVLPQKSGESWGVSWYGSFVSKVGVGRAAEAEGAWRSWNILNQSLAGTLYRLSTPIAEAESSEGLFDVSLWSAGPRGLKLLTILAQLAVVGFLAWVTKGRSGRWSVDSGQTEGGGRPQSSRSTDHRPLSTAPERSFRRLGEGGAVICAMLLLSPMSSKQHFCALFVPIAWCTAEFLYRRRDWIVGGALAFVFAATTLMVKDVVGRPLGNLALGYGSLTFATLACFAATGWVLLRDRSAARAAEAPADVHRSDSTSKNATPSFPRRRES